MTSCACGVWKGRFLEWAQQGWGLSWRCRGLTVQGLLEPELCDRADPTCHEGASLWYFDVSQASTQAVPKWGEGCCNSPSKPMSLCKAILQEKNRSAAGEWAYWPGNGHLGKGPKSSPSLPLSSSWCSQGAMCWAAEDHIEGELPQWRSTGQREPRKERQTQCGKSGDKELKSLGPRFKPHLYHLLSIDLQPIISLPEPLFTRFWATDAPWVAHLDGSVGFVCESCSLAAGTW